MAHAAVMLQVSGKVIRFDTETVTLQVNGASMVVPRSAISDSSALRPGRMISATLTGPSLHQAQPTQKK